MFKKIWPLSLILSLRFLGLFIVLPVLSIYALDMKDSTPFLVGIIVGGYALTQAIFQFPFGYMSDKIGRKITLFIGLTIFLIGSLICATSDNIYILILGRFLQGAGAIGSVIPAMISDMVEEEIRGKAMAMMGGFIALSFAAAMMLGPVLSSSFGVEFLFYLTAIFAAISIVVLFTKVATPPRIIVHFHEKSSTSDILKDTNLLTMIIINAMQKGLMTIAFVLIPIILTSSVADGGFAWEKSELYIAYAPAMVLGLLAMGPAAVFGEKKNIPKQIFLISIALFILAFALMGFAPNATLFVVGVISFFIAFNMMEPLVQSMISKFAKVHQKGAALGISNSIAYFTTFLGAMGAGFMLDIGARDMLIYIVIALGVLWLLWTLKLSNPKRYSHLYINLDKVDIEKLKVLEHNSIAQWYINDTENLAVIKYEKDAIKEDELISKVEKS